MWEGSPWIIEFDFECSAYGGGEPCSHCHSDREITHTRYHDDSTYTERVWICPRIVIAYNEGNFNSTGVCLDGILDAADSIGDAKHV